MATARLAAREFRGSLELWPTHLESLFGHASYGLGQGHLLYDT